LLLPQRVLSLRIIKNQAAYVPVAGVENRTCHCAITTVIIKIRRSG